MFRAFRERCIRIVAEAVPARLAYYVALRVLNHAAYTRFEDIPAARIKFREALEEWRLAKLSRPGEFALGETLATLKPSGPAGEGVIVPRPVPSGEMLAQGIAYLGGEGSADASTIAIRASEARPIT